MKRLALPFSLALAGLALAACEPNPDHTPKIAEEQIQAMDKARALEGSLQQQTDQQMEQIDQQTE